MKWWSGPSAEWWIASASSCIWAEFVFALCFEVAILLVGGGGRNVNFCRGLPGFASSLNLIYWLNLVLLYLNPIFHVAFPVTTVFAYLLCTCIEMKCMSAFAL